MTAQGVYALAVALMDEQGVTGAFDTAENVDFKNRVLPLLTVLISECRMAGRALPRESLPAPESMNDVLNVPCDVAAGVLPYGLAAMLTLESAPEISGVFLRRYQESLSLYARTSGAEMGEIEDVYA